MARFRLTAKHYINVTVPGRRIIWRYEEVSRDGIASQQEFPVPLYLDPEDPRWHNSPEGIIVATEASKEHPRDYILAGEPTIDMEPLDEEAEALRESLMPKWTNPIETLPAQGLSPGEQAFIDAFARQMSQMPQQPAVDMSLIQKRLDALEAENKSLKEKLEAKPEVTARRA